MRPRCATRFETARKDVDVLKRRSRRRRRRKREEGCLADGHTDYRLPAVRATKQRFSHRVRIRLRSGWHIQRPQCTLKDDENMQAVRSGSKRVEDGRTSSPTTSCESLSADIERTVGTVRAPARIRCTASRATKRAGYCEVGGALLRPLLLLLEASEAREAARTADEAASPSE
jgi:hypothetical protein